MGFCEEIWAEVASLRQAIQELPFLEELKNGTLSQASFHHYILQDSLYLSEYGRALAMASARAPNAAGQLEFSDGAKGAVQVEEALHQSFFAMFGVPEASVKQVEPSPVCLGYTSYLSSLAATRTYEELIAGILPCFWIYWEVGCAIKPQSAPDNPYAAWIDTYADTAFGESTKRVCALVDEAAEQASPAVRAKMAEAFRRATRFEWMFWDSAYHQRGWPI